MEEWLSRKKRQPKKRPISGLVDQSETSLCGVSSVDQASLHVLLTHSISQA